MAWGNVLQNFLQIEIEAECFDEGLDDYLDRDEDEAKYTPFLLQEY